MTKKNMARSRSSSSSAVATDTATYEMVIRSCKPRCFLNPSSWRLRSVGCLALSLFFKTLLFLARKTCRYAQYITLLVGGSKGVASPGVFHFFAWSAMLPEQRAIVCMDCVDSAVDLIDIGNIIEHDYL